MKVLSMLGAAGLAILLAGNVFAHDDEAPKFKASIDVKGAKEGEFSGLAKVSFQKALATAMAEIKGSIVEFKGELENENGLIWSFEADLADGGEVEVNLDAGTGKVLEVDKQTKAQKEKEEAEEKKEKKGEKDGDD